MWIHRVIKVVCIHLSQDLKEELCEIDARLRVKLSMESTILVMNKLFSLTSNYSKGNGDAFRAYIEEYYPDYLLYYVSNTKGNRQDIICSYIGLGYIDTAVYIEYLDKRLRVYDMTNILEENMYTLLSSQAIVAMFYLFGIVDLSIVSPIR